MNSKQLWDFFRKVKQTMLSPKKRRFPKQARMKGISGRGNKTRFRKQHRGRMKGISRRGNSISFGRYAARYPFSRYAARYAIKVFEPTWIPVRQIEAGRRAITRYVGRWAKIRVLPNEKPLIMMNMETRDYKVYVKPYYILFEISGVGVSETIARRALTLLQEELCKMPTLPGPIKTQIIYIK